jgi:hypothetical protein
MPVTLATFSSAGAAAAQSPISRARTAPSALTDAVGLEHDRYAIVSTEDLSLHDAALVFDSATAAHAAWSALLRQKPELTGSVQVMPAAVLDGLEVPA